MNSKITKKDMKYAAKCILNYLENNKVKTLKDIKRLYSERIHNPEYCEAVKISKRKSIACTEEYKIKYNNGIERLIEIKINKDIGYTKFIAKCKTHINKEYTQYGKDENGIRQQTKTIQSTRIPDIKQELSNLLN